MGIVRRVDHADRVAVRRGAREFGEADAAAGAGTVHDHDAGVVPQVLRHVLRGEPRDHVAAAARRVRHDHLDRLLGPGRERHAGGRGDGGQHQGRHEAAQECGDGLHFSCLLRDPG